MSKIKVVAAATPVTNKVSKVKNKVSKVTNKVSMKTRLTFLQPFIKAGKHTQKQLCALVNEVYVGHTEAANNTLLVDAKNVKYCGFEYVAKVNDKGFYTFNKTKKVTAAQRAKGYSLTKVLKVK